MQIVIFWPFAEGVVSEASMEQLLGPPVLHRSQVENRWKLGNSSLTVDLVDTLQQI